MIRFYSNRLRVPSNAKTVLNYLKSQKSLEQAPAQFSLNSIKKMPPSLYLELNEPVKILSLMNIELPAVDEATQKKAIFDIMKGWERKEPAAVLQNKIEELRTTLLQSASQGSPPPKNPEQASDLQLLEQALDNYQQTGFFSHYDWRLTHWGTPQDIYTVTETSFELPTVQLEFQTAWLPPIKAMQILADTFPSVSFELSYQDKPGDPWTSMEVFPITPFGY